MLVNSFLLLTVSYLGKVDGWSDGLEGALERMSSGCFFDWI